MKQYGPEALMVSTDCPLHSLLWVMYFCMWNQFYVKVAKKCHEQDNQTEASKTVSLGKKHSIYIVGKYSLQFCKNVSVWN